MKDHLDFRSDGVAAVAPSAAHTTRVIIVDDHPAIREALASALGGKHNMDVAGEAGTASEAMRLIEADPPDVVVLDICLGDAHGLDLVKHLRTRFPEVRVVVYSMYDEMVYAERSYQAGASAYLMKSEPTNHVVEAIRVASRGEMYLSQRMATVLLGKVIRGRDRKIGSPLDILSDREMAVFQMLGEGCSMTEIAERLHLDRKTVETYRRRAKEKLGLPSVTDLLQYAVQWTLGYKGDREFGLHRMS
jgi:DNA-binding NarL/FixJ family response regulator